MKLDINIFNREITVIGVHSSTNDASVTSKDLFWEKIGGDVEKISRHEEVILMGDMNARIGKLVNSIVVGRFRELVKNDNGNRLIEICETHNLKINNTFF